MTNDQGPFRHSGSVIHSDFGFRHSAFLVWRRPIILAPMHYRPLGTTDVKVSEISFGCWTMGGLNFVDGTPNGWANVNEDEITAGIKAAIDAGVNHFDNADVYGNGRAEAHAFARAG